jgi:hypothetical protein
MASSSSRRQKSGGNLIPRREVLRSGAATVAATIAFPYIITAQVRGANDKIRVACIGTAGKGDSDTQQLAAIGAEIVALCDVDETNLNRKSQSIPGAKLFRDYRKMLVDMEKSIDAVTISIPDHQHGLAAATAMKMGKHVYCQKPLTQTVYEARLLRQLAKETKVATQMGNQGSAGPGLRRAVEVMHAGLIGAPKELHVWSNRPIWPQGIARPEGEDPVPATLDWDMWLGCAPVRPYKQGAYHSFNWRGWTDFGTGALGDMACHTVNMPFRALKLGFPNVVECEATSELFPETYPKTSRIRFEFPEREGWPAMKFWWYDGAPPSRGGGRGGAGGGGGAGAQAAPFRPNEEITKDIIAMRGSLPASGALIVGEKGQVFSPDDEGQQFYIKLTGEDRFMGGDNHEAARVIPETLPRLPRGDTDTQMKEEWFKMIRDGTLCYSNFDIAAYLTEIILLGCIALRVGVGKRMEWDGPNMKSLNLPEAAKFVSRERRKGWEL